VNVLWPINAEAYQHIVFLKESAPRIIERNAVGLKSVMNLLSRPSIVFDKLHRSLKEGKPHQRRLSPLPRDCDDGGTMRFQ
jgi:hypothetical protein